jgi:adenine specific DNA methylase Mod
MKLAIVTFLSLLIIAPAALGCEGNNDRDWGNLKQAKPNYCSTPFKWQWFEDKNWKWCKVHDNHRGNKGKIPKSQADDLMLCDCRTKSDMIEPIKTPLCYVSYLVVRYFHE